MVREFFSKCVGKWYADIKRLGTVALTNTQRYRLDNWTKKINSKMFLLLFESLHRRITDFFVFETTKNLDKDFK